MSDATSSLDILAQHILTTYAGVLWNVARKHGPRGEAEDSVSALRLHLLEKREVIARKVAGIGWESQHAKNYIAAACRNYLRDRGKKKDITARGRRLALESKAGKLVPYSETLQKMDGRSAGLVGGCSRTLKTRTLREMNEIEIPIAQWTAADLALQRGEAGMRKDMPDRLPRLNVVIPIRTFEPSTVKIDLQRELEKLPAAQAEVFRARHTEGRNGDFRVLETPRPWREVAEITGTPERTAQRRVKEAAEAIRAALEPERV